MAPGLPGPGSFASKAAQAALVGSSFGEPLLSHKRSRTGSVSSSEDSDDEGEDAPGPRFAGKNLVPSVAVALLSAGGLAASAAAMVTMPGALVFVMGGVCMLNAPAVAAKHVNIVKHDGVQQSIQKIRQQREVLEEEIDSLSRSVDDLKEETDTLKDLEEHLQDIATKSRMNVSAIVDMVNDNENVLSEMKSNLRENFVQSMIKVVMRSDKDGDMKIDGKEIHLLSLRLQIQLEPYGISLDTDMFEDMVRQDNEISSVLKFCGRMLFPDDENDSANSDDSDEDDEEIGDLEAFCKTLGEDEEPPLTFEEKMGMITVNEQFSKGSVEVARGGRMTMVAAKSTGATRRKTIMKEVKKRQTVLAARQSPG